MKTLSLIIGLTGICLVGQTQTNEEIVSSETKVVINHRMIANFNSVDYPAEQIDFNYILSNFSFIDARDAIVAYHSGKIETVTVQSVNAFLAERDCEAAGSQNPLPDGTDNQLLVTQK